MQAAKGNLFTGASIIKPRTHKQQPKMNNITFLPIRNFLKQTILIFAKSLGVVEHKVFLDFSVSSFAIIKKIVTVYLNHAVEDHFN